MSKEIVGFTAGSFDLLHPGYIYTFEEARRHCDKFLVFLQRDPSSTRYTKYKPVIPYYERYKTLMTTRIKDLITVQTVKQNPDILKKK
jgi:glycerol-3-phosphate cytidylyltransferase